MRGKNELWELSGVEGDFLHFYVEEADRFVPSPPKNAKGMSGNPRRKVPKTAKSCHVTFLAPEVLPSVGFSFFWSEKRLKISKSEQHLIPCC